MSPVLSAGNRHGARGDTDLPDPVKLVLKNTAASTQKSFTFNPALTERWDGAGSPTSVGLYGTYTMSLDAPIPSLSVIKGEILQGTPVVWHSGSCSYPTEGTLNLTVYTPASTTIPGGSATVTFGPDCNTLSINNNKITLGSAN